MHLRSDSELLFQQPQKCLQQEMVRTIIRKLWVEQMLRFCAAAVLL